MNKENLLDLIEAYKNLITQKETDIQTIQEMVRITEVDVESPDHPEMAKLVKEYGTAMTIWIAMTRDFITMTRDLVQNLEAKVD